MLIAFFKISRCRMRYSTSLCNCRIVCAFVPDSAAVHQFAPAAAASSTPSSIHADWLRYTQARAQSAPNSRRCGPPSPLLGFCIAPYKPVALSFLLPSGPLSFFEFPCPSNRGRFTPSGSAAPPLPLAFLPPTCMSSFRSPHISPLRNNVAMLWVPSWPEFFSAFYSHAHLVDPSERCLDGALCMASQR